MATFSVNDQVRRVVATGDGSNDAFDFSFQVNATTDVKVYVDGALKTASSHYNVVNSSNAAGLNTDGTGRERTELVFCSQIGFSSGVNPQPER